MQVCHHNPTTAFINCMESTQQQVVRLLLMFVAYCLDALSQQPPTIHNFRARFINDSAFDDTLLASMKAGVSRLPYTPRTQLPCTFDMVQHIIYKNTRESFSQQFVKAEAASMAYYLCFDSHQFYSQSVEFQIGGRLVSCHLMRHFHWTQNRVGQVHVAACQEYQRGIWRANLVRCERFEARRSNISPACVPLGSNESQKPRRPFPLA